MARSSSTGVQGAGLGFNLFVDQDDPTDKRMLYELWFTDDQGRRRTLAGHKVIIDSPGLDLWPDTTTLYTKILDGHVEGSGKDAATVVAAPAPESSKAPPSSESGTPSGVPAMIIG